MSTIDTIVHGTDRFRSRVSTIPVYNSLIPINMIQKVRRAWYPDNRCIEFCKNIDSIMARSYIKKCKKYLRIYSLSYGEPRDLLEKMM